MMVRSDRLNHLSPYFLIAAAALLCHGLLLLNDGTYFDDWLLQSMLTEDRWDDLYNWSSQMGLPISAYFWWGVKLGGGHYKAVAFLCKLFSAVLIYKICLRLIWVNRYEALGIALLSLAYPAYQTAVIFGDLRYEFCYFLFLLAAWLLLRSAPTNSSRGPGVLSRLVSLLLFFLAFNLNSLLVFYYSFLLLLFFHLKQAHSLSWSATAKTLLPRYLDFILLPFVYWTGKKVLFPTHGLYEGYNALNLNVDSVVVHLFAFSKTAGYAQVDASVSRLLEHPLIWLLAMIGTYLAYFTIRKSNDAAISTEHEVVAHKPPNSIWLLLFGVLMLVSGVFAYAAVGLSPALSGWNTRHTVLVALPMALLIVAALRPIWVSRLNDRQGGIDRRLISILIGCSLLTAFSLSTITYYIGWQARAVKDRAIMTDLLDANVLRKFSVFWIDDQYPLGGERLYRFYEWSSMFKKTWGGESRIGLQIQGYNGAALTGLKQYYIKLYNLSEFDPSGCQAGLTITRGVLQYSESELAWQYLLHRFIKQDQLVDFLHKVVHIDVQFPREIDVRCPRKL